MEKALNNMNEDNKLTFEVATDERVKLQGGGDDTNCDRPGGFLWGSNSKSNCSC